MDRKRIALCVTLGLYALGCGGHAEGQGDRAAPSQPLVAAAPAGERAAAAIAPGQPFGGGERAFQQLREDLRKRYYRELSDDEIYGAAARGLLEHLEPDGGKGQGWNKLLSPAEMAELRADLRGEVVGIGVEIHVDEASGICDVLGVLPGSPAEGAGVREGDKILTIDGKRYQGRPQKEIVGALRGKAGDELRLLILRGADLVTLKLRRARVPFEVVSSARLDGGLGYVQLKSFSEGTPEALRAALQGLAQSQALVLDLRGNQGGLLEKAIACGELLLPKGATIVRVPRRGVPEEVHVAKGGAALGPRPVAVLVSGTTSSGAELLAAALREGRGAILVGGKTFGKWSAQTIEDLDNGFAAKFTISQFRTGAGKSYEGEGLLPDVEVAMDDGEVPRLQRLRDPAARVQRDVALRTALGLLRAQLGRR